MQGEMIMDNDEMFVKLYYFYDNNKPVHIMKTNNIWVNGKVIILKEDHCIIEDFFGMGRVIHFKEIFEVSEFIEKKK